MTPVRFALCNFRSSPKVEESGELIVLKNENALVLKTTSGLIRFNASLFMPVRKPVHHGVKKLKLFLKKKPEKPLKYIVVTMQNRKTLNIVFEQLKTILPVLRAGQWYHETIFASHSSTTAIQPLRSGSQSNPMIPKINPKKNIVLPGTVCVKVAVEQDSVPQYTFDAELILIEQEEVFVLKAKNGVQKRCVVSEFEFIREQHNTGARELVIRFKNRIEDIGCRSELLLRIAMPYAFTRECDKLKNMFSEPSIEDCIEDSPLDQLESDEASLSSTLINQSFDSKTCPSFDRKPSSFIDTANAVLPTAEQLYETIDIDTSNSGMNNISTNQFMELEEGGNMMDDRPSVTEPRNMLSAVDPIEEPSIGHIVKGTTLEQQASDGDYVSTTNQLGCVRSLVRNPCQITDTEITLLSTAEQQSDTTDVVMPKNDIPNLSVIETYSVSEYVEGTTVVGKSLNNKPSIVRSREMEVDVKPSVARPPQLTQCVDEKPLLGANRNVEAGAVPVVVSHPEEKNNAEPTARTELPLLVVARSMGVSQSTVPKSLFDALLAQYENLQREYYNLQLSYYCLLIARENGANGNR